MTTDREVLMFLHERLEHIYGENHLFDYMHRLRAIILATPKYERVDGPILNSMDDLHREIEDEEKRTKRRGPPCHSADPKGG